MQHTIGTQYNPLERQCWSKWRNASYLTNQCLCVKFKRQSSFFIELILCYEDVLVDQLANRGMRHVETKLNMPMNEGKIHACHDLEPYAICEKIGCIGPKIHVMKCLDYDWIYKNTWAMAVILISSNVIFSWRVAIVWRTPK